MRLVIKNSIQLCLRTLVFSIVLRHSNYNNRTISIVSLFLGHPVQKTQPLEIKISLLSTRFSAPGNLKY